MFAIWDAKSVTEIQVALAAYLTVHSLPTQFTSMEKEHKTGGTLKAVRHSAILQTHTLLQPSIPLEVLGLSSRPHNMLARSGVRTVDQLVTMSQQELRAVKHLGSKSFAEESRAELEDYLASPDSPWTPLQVLGLSHRAYYALMSDGIHTVERLF